MKNKFKILYAVIFIAILVFINFSINKTDYKKEEEQLNILKDAITRSAVQCYAIEGMYPPNINYLIENYGLSVNEEKYVIYYSVFASNIMPEVEVYIK
ncbi:MAG: hypothetical protein K0Q97_1905 [Bacillota bacterium]|nr:hypothetical protein [Bacillota bacterium]